MKKTKSKPKSKLENEIIRDFEHQSKMMNGLADAIMGTNTWGVQLSQTDTLFKNLRYYLVSNMRQLLSQAYVEHGLVQTVCDVPVNDAMRGGVKIFSAQISEDDIKILNKKMDENGDLKAVAQALKWNRLYGGAGVMIITNQDPYEPLNWDLITEDSPMEFRAADMWELFWDKQTVEGYNPAIQEYGFSHYSYYSKNVHISRVMVMKGITPPSFVKPRLRGWGLSVVEALVRSINQYLKANDLTFELLDEFKLDIFKIKGLTQMLLAGDAGDAKVRKRVQLANQQKNYLNSIVMDGEDDYAQKQLSFSGLAETLREIRMQIASDLRMPLTKIFGISAAGFSSGQDDIENYNAMVTSEIREVCKYDILKIIKLRCKQLFGFVPDDLEIEFEPMRMLSAEQEENVKTQKFARLMQARQAGLMTTKEFKDACNRDNLLSIKLDTSVDVLDPLGEPGGTTEKIPLDKDRNKKSKTEPKEAEEAAE